MYFLRHAEQYLATWLTSSARKPLVIRGARQVGKTALVRAFCETRQLDLVEINLEEFRVSEFSRETFDTDRCLNEMLALKNKRLTNKTVLFLDEIQEDEKAYSRLRFFFEKRPEIPVIAAGSLLEIRLREAPQKIPVGRVEFLYLGPCVFSEFLSARRQDALLDLLEKPLFDQGISRISESLHEQLVRQLMDFLFVGGMPEAIRRFVEEDGNYTAARDAQHQILNAYLEDVGRYATGKVAEVIRDVLERISFELGNKVIFSRLSSAKSTYVKSAIDILESVFLMQKVFHTSASGIPLRKTEDADVFKIYFLDVGLYNCLLDVRWSDIAGLDYDSLLSKGAMAEQFIAQHLYLGKYQTVKPRLHYWLREKSTENAEVDFIRCVNNAICPIEVKSGKAGRMKSLIKLMTEKETLVTQAIRFDLAYREKLRENIAHRVPGDDHHRIINFQLLNIPLYAAEYFQTYLEQS